MSSSKNKSVVPYKPSKTNKTFIGPSPLPNKTNIPIDLNAYKDKCFNWSINMRYLCQKQTCKNLCKKDECFSLYDIAKDDLFVIFAKFDQYRDWTWRKIEAGNGTSNGMMPIEDLETKDMVFRHLNSLKMDDEHLYKIEIKGSHRVWGIRRDNIFYPIWNDPLHKFYKPRNKNYTLPKKVA